MTKLRKGQRIEITPFPKAHKVSFDYLAHMDGKKGEVVSTSGHGDELKAMVKVEGGLGAVEFPARALRPIK